MAALGLMPVDVQAREPQVHALVIGIDEYEHIGSLKGAVNDANDISDALSDLPGAQVTTLLNDAATRDAILDHWRKTAKQVQPGDTMIVTYAGHGWHEPEAHPGNETDGQDETFLLGAFAEQGAAAAHRIRDDEVAELVALIPDGATMILVADSCHSGTMMRSVRNVHGYRYFDGDKITDDPLPPPPPKTRPDDLVAANTIFLSAVADSELAPEMEVDGEIRGALSIAFAEAMRGFADADRNGVLTKGELEVHVLETVKSISSGIQRPQVGPAGHVDTHAVSLSADAVASIDNVVNANPFTLGFDALPPQKVWTSQSGVFFPSGAQSVDSETSASLIIDTQSDAMFSSIGDTLATLPDDPADAAIAVQRMVDKRRILDELRQYDPGQPLDVSFQGGNGTYKDGETVVTHIGGRESDKIWLLHLSSTGTITHLFPLAEYNDPTTSAPSDTLAIPLGVTSPFGADAIIAIEAKGEIPELDQTLRLFNGQSDMAGLWDSLHGTLAERDDVAVAVFSFFTTQSDG
ncbi:caspase family protein [Actibacterium mucosum]|nr:caspase family protein [Actibacterium mucosum]